MAARASSTSSRSSPVCSRIWTSNRPLVNVNAHELQEGVTP
ncbi:hypothetical protein [Delftia acidovorans]